MPLFDRDEIERHWAHDQKVARRCGPAGDWTELRDLHTEAATMIDEHRGWLAAKERCRGRSAA